MEKTKETEESKVTDSSEKIEDSEDSEDTEGSEETEGSEDVGMPINIFDSIDYNNLSELLSDDKFLSQFVSSVVKNKAKEKSNSTEMSMPDINDLLFDQNKN